MSLAALRHRNFRLLWLGLLFSFVGSFMQTAALLWHVSLAAPPSHKGLALGLVGLVRVIPIVVFSMVSGVVADAWNRQRLMLLTQLCAAAVAVTLAVITLLHRDAIWMLYALAFVGSAVSSFDLPARQSLMPTLVPRSDLPSAISLNAIMGQAASVTGPALGGLLIGWTGLASVYLVNAASFGCVIAALLLMRDVPEVPASERPSRVSWHAALDGLRFVFGAPLIRSTMLLDFFATFFSSAVTLLPIYAQDILRVGPRGYGWLYAAPAAGAVVMSTLMLWLAPRIERRGVVLLWAVGAYGLATVVFGMSRSFWLACAALAITGVADTVSMVFRGIIRQLETPDELRGRMSGINMMFFAGGPQLGELEAGLLAQWLGAPVSVMSGGIACIVITGVVAALTPQLRAYRRPELAPAARGRDG